MEKVKKVCKCGNDKFNFVCELWNATFENDCYDKKKYSPIDGIFFECRKCNKMYNTDGIEVVIE
jgi:hypothetical protein